MFTQSECINSRSEPIESYFHVDFGIEPNFTEYQLA